MINLLKKNGKIINTKSSISGYSVYGMPKTNEYDKIDVCKNRGFWQYDFPKYITLVSNNKDIKFSEKGTRNLVIPI